ncbi:WLM domain protein [Ceratobasidium sp. AG-Ba]|nr:WLM domain protein [Ceratobasidium sp. AG-Ba]
MAEHPTVEEAHNTLALPQDTPAIDVLLRVNHGSTMLEVVMPSNSSIDDLKRRLYELTYVPASKQKLLWKGMKRGAATLQGSGLQNGSKITMVGTPQSAIEAMHHAEAEASRRLDIMRKREARGPTKVRDTSGSSTSSTQILFYRTEPLSYLPNPIQAQSILNKLANDPAILHVMRLHKFTVGLLTELAPHEHPNLLGLNVNGGQSILLRIRTDSYDGFRSYGEVRRVLCHELTHNVYGGHGDDFKTLNSRLNREVAEFEQAAKAGSHTLSGSDARDDYGVNVQKEAALQTFTLGGSANVGQDQLSDDREERRQRILAAAMARLEREEREIEDRCGG